MAAENKSKTRRRKPCFSDVRVVEDQAGEQTGGGVAVATQTTTAATPIIVQMELEPRTQRTVEIIDISSNDRVVTAIEVLSPGNKVGYENQMAYRKKRDAYTQSGVHLVEIEGSPTKSVCQITWVLTIG